MNNETNEKSLVEADLRILLGDLLRAARRMWWLVIVMAVVFSAVFGLKARIGYHPMYQATATFTVYVSDPMQSEIRGYNTATAEQMAKTFPYILTSGALQDVVREDLGISALPEITAETAENTNIFTLKVTAKEAELAHQVLDSVIRRYPEISEFVVGPTVMNLLDESGVPAAPYNSPDYAGCLKWGVLLGVGLWVILLLLLAMSHAGVHNEEELKRMFSARCMGSLPRVRRRGKGEDSTCPMVGSETENMSFSEAVYLLRARVEKFMQGHQKKVLLVFSATPGEGKTTVAINLAKTLAMRNKKVLLVDCDLRNPSVAKNLGFKKEEPEGMTEFLNGKLPEKELIRKMETEKFDFVAAGNPEDNAAELLAGEKFKSFLKKYRENYEYVILDTPPVSLLADASEIGAQADAALLVVRQNFASKTQIMESVQILSESDLPLAGCVLNCTTGSILTGQSGYYGYGYGYGYSHYGHYSHYSHYK